MATYVLTYNPERWTWPHDDRSRAVAATARGEVVPDQWSTGGRAGGIGPGDRAVLLRQGRGARGLIARGSFTTAVYQDKHWDGSGGLANFAALDWDLVLEDEDVIPLADVAAAVTTVNWNYIQGSGIVVPSPGDLALEELWDSFGYPHRVGGQGWQSDPVKRRQVEDHAQRLLEQHFAQDGWRTEDTRRGNPFDAVARRGQELLYLEAKGTETDGRSVLVTAGEVEWARSHPGECVLGIASGICFDAEGELDPNSGMLSIHDWNPDAGSLTPKSYSWCAPS